jgi:hypothetical protein
LGKKREYKFSYATGNLVSRPMGDKTFKKVKRIKLTSISKKDLLKVIKNAGTWTKIGRK